jgi:hypothetical protein
MKTKVVSFLVNLSIIGVFAGGLILLVCSQLGGTVLGTVPQHLFFTSRGVHFFEDMQLRCFYASIFLFGIGVFGGIYRQKCINFLHEAQSALGHLVGGDKHAGTKPIFWKSAKIYGVFFGNISCFHQYT